jgi:hypothetical protein
LDAGSVTLIKGLEATGRHHPVEDDSGRTRRNILTPNHCNKAAAIADVGSKAVGYDTKETVRISLVELPHCRSVNCNDFLLPNALNVFVDMRRTKSFANS